MNKALKSASDRYNELTKKEFLIHPISKVDAEIITELYEIVKKAELGLVQIILSEYKFRKDTEVLDKLLQYNIDHPIGSQKEGTKVPVEEIEEKKAPFFLLGDFMLKSYHIVSLKKFEEYDDIKEDYIYGIILNPLPEGPDIRTKLLFSDEKIIFETEENRNKILENLTLFLSKEGIDVIDLN